MNVFVTGATGFIGHHLLEKLLARPELEICVLVREGSRARFVASLARHGTAASRIHVVTGDLTRPGLLDRPRHEVLPSRIDHLFHLAAVYDMGMTDEEANRINLDGTREVVAFANALGPDVHLHHVSSIAVSGDRFEGTFLESDFDVGQPLEHPYYRSKFESERIVREECRVPWRIYRPGIVVGHSRSGAIAKADGPYYFFDKVRLVSAILARWLPLPFVEGGRMPLVPVDYVGSALDAIAFQEGLDGRVFALVPPDPPSVGELVSVLFDVAGGPRVHRLRSPFAARLAHAFVGRARRFVPAWLSRLVSRFLAAPTSVLGQLFSQATYDDRNTRRALAGTEVVCPSFRDIAPTLWEGWRAFAGASSPALPAPRGLPSPEGDALVSERSGPARASSS